MLIVGFRFLYVKHTFDFVHVCLVVTIEFLKEKHITKWEKPLKDVTYFTHVWEVSCCVCLLCYIEWAWFG